MEDKYEAIRLRNQLCFPIYLCSKELVCKYSEVLEEYNLTYTQYIAMLYIWEHGESNLKEMAKIMMLDASTLTPLLKKLEHKGFIKRARSPLDERNLVIQLTEEGKALQDRVIEVPQKMGKCLNLSEQEAKTLYELIYKVVLGLK